MISVNRILIFFIFVSTSGLLSAQLSDEAFENYSKSEYDIIDTLHESDALIIFDRTYYEMNKIIDDKLHKVVQYTTVHRKIKINSLYGLEQFNKLYIPTFTDLQYKVEIVNCLVKTLKYNNSSVYTDTSLFVTTTLPANAPFFYKIKGSVKMLALSDVNLGDEIEYVYKTKEIYNVFPEHFYMTDKVFMSDENYCMEKAYFFESSRFEIRILPYHFNNGITRRTDFDYKTGKKISLTDINKQTYHYYTNKNLHQPYFYYLVSQYNHDDEDNTWKYLTNNFKPKRREINRSLVFSGEKIFIAEQSISKLMSTKSKFELLLQKINSPIEENIHYYELVEDDIDIAWSYALNISKLMSNLKIPLSFHFVVNKNLGNFDKSYVSLYQFDNILISFNDENGDKHYMPILEPFAKLDEIKTKFQDTECFTISQTESGKRTFSFDRIPELTKANRYSKTVNLNISESDSDWFVFDVDESIEYSGHAWLDIKPHVFHIIKDTVNRISRIKRFVEDQIVYSSEIDSAYQIEYVVDSTEFSVHYKYSFKQRIIKDSKIFSLKPDMFIENKFYTPYHLREKREFPGYLFDEPDVTYSININLNENYNWLENELLNDKYENTLVGIEVNYLNSDSILKISYHLFFKQDRFKVEEWPELLIIRDKFYNFLNGDLYFRN